MKQSTIIGAHGRPLVYVAGIFTIGPYMLLVRRARAPYKGMWTFPTQLVTDDLKPQHMLQDLATSHAGIIIGESRIVTMEPLLYRQDGLDVRALQIIYTADITNRTRPDIDTWGAEHASAARMVHKKEYGLEMGFEQARCVGLFANQSQWK